VKKPERPGQQHTARVGICEHLVYAPTQLHDQRDREHPFLIRSPQRLGSGAGFECVGPLPSIRRATKQHTQHILLRRVRPADPGFDLTDVRGRTLRAEAQRSAKRGAAQSCGRPQSAQLLPCGASEGGDIG
jgi:hypothetical protein